MRRFLRLLAVLGLCLGVAAGVIAWLTAPERPSRTGRAPSLAHAAPPSRTVDEPGVFDVFLDRFEDGGYGTAVRFMAPIRDRASLLELGHAVRGRSERGIRDLLASQQRLTALTRPSTNQLLERISVEKSLGLLFLYEGRFAEAKESFERALKSCRADGVPTSVQDDLTVLLGIVALRRGEVENCIACSGPSSCIFPIDVAAVHQNPAGSREAVRRFTEYLERHPKDLRVIWLLNIAAMTLGQHPEDLPRRYRLPLSVFESKLDIGRFENVADAAGLGTHGPVLAGGSVFDDFTGDGRPDLFTTSLDVDRGASIFVNRGDGTFEERSDDAGLAGQIYALNVTRTDFDNDGDLDVLLLRGGWEWPAPLSLLRNRGDGTFDDVTESGGLGDPIASEAAAWGDYDTATARSRTSPLRPACATTVAARGRPGATTTATASSTCSSRTSASPAGSTITKAAAGSATSPRSWG
jgi:hypothetical protein